MIMISWTKLIIYGVILGCAGLVPGLSCGTVAVVFNIYDKLISSISNIKTEFNHSMRFLFPLAIGAFLGILFLSKIITYSINNYPLLSGTFFAGLVVGCFPSLWEKTVSKSFKKSIIPAFLCGFILMILTIIIMPESSSTVFSSITFESFIKLFFSGVLAAVAMIIPGISGSFMFLLLGCYTTIVSALSIDNINISVLIPVAMGAMFGMFFGAKLINSLLKIYPKQTYAVICGLIAGSLFEKFPQIPFNAKGAFSLISLFVGFMISFWFSSPSRTKISLHSKNK